MYFRIKEFEKEHRRITNLLSTWDLQKQEPNTSGASSVLINLDSPKISLKSNADEPLIGVRHFVAQTKLDVELSNSRVDQIDRLVEDVHREKPNISVVVDKLLPLLPSREEIRKQLGYGPLPMEIPAKATFSAVHLPIKREEAGQRQRYFTVVPSSESIDLFDVCWSRCVYV